MILLDNANIPTHFIRRHNMQEQVVHQTDAIPVHVTVRNIAAGTIVDTLGIPEGTNLPRPLIEFTHEDNPLNLVSEDHIEAFGWADEDELELISTIAFRTNDFLSGYFMALKLKLVDITLQFGRLNPGTLEESLVLIDEVSPDICRLWDTTSDRRYGRDVCEGSPEEIHGNYDDIAQRLGITDGRRPNLSLATKGK